MRLVGLRRSGQGNSNALSLSYVHQFGLLSRIAAWRQTSYARRHWAARASRKSGCHAKVCRRCSVTRNRRKPPRRFTGAGNVDHVAIDAVSRGFPNELWLLCVNSKMQYIRIWWRGVIGFSLIRFVLLYSRYSTKRFANTKLKHGASVCVFAEGFNLYILIGLDPIKHLHKTGLITKAELWQLYSKFITRYS